MTFVDDNLPVKILIIRGILEILVIVARVTSDESFKEQGLSGARDQGARVDLPVFSRKFHPS